MQRFTTAPAEGKKDTGKTTAEDLELGLESPGRADAPVVEKAEETAATAATPEATESVPETAEPAGPEHMSDTQLKAEMATLEKSVMEAIKSGDNQAKMEAFNALFPIKKEQRRRAEQGTEGAGSKREAGDARFKGEMAEAAAKKEASKGAAEKAFAEKQQEGMKRTTWAEKVGKQLERYADILKDKGITRQDLGLDDPAQWDDVTDTQLEDWRTEMIARVDEKLRRALPDKKVTPAYIDQKIKAARAVNDLARGISDYRFEVKHGDLATEPTKKPEAEKFPRAA